MYLTGILLLHLHLTRNQNRREVSMQIPKPSPKKKSKKKRVTPLPALVRNADKVFALFIRNRDAVELQGRCCTCGAPGNQAGHFVKRSWKKIRWNPLNVHLQCCQCNHFKGGNEAEYSRFIIKKYGIETFHWLLDQKVPHKVTREDLARIILAYS